MHGLMYSPKQRRAESGDMRRCLEALLPADTGRSASTAAMMWSRRAAMSSSHERQLNALRSSAWLGGPLVLVSS